MSQMPLETDIWLSNGKTLHKETITKLTKNILQLFAEEQLTYEEARIIMDKLQHYMREYCVFKDLSEGSPENT